MKNMIYAFLLVLMVCGCEKATDDEIYNENNTSVLNGVVYDLDEKPINGIYKTYYSNGNIKMEVFARKGIPHGEGKFYDENGNLQYSVNFEKGKIDGKLYQYYEDGNIHNELNYVNGLQDGAQFLYDNKEQILAEIVYDNGKVVSGYVIIEGEKTELSEDELQKLLSETKALEQEIILNSTEEKIDNSEPQE